MAVAPAPSWASLDRRQVGALVELLVKQALRPGIDASTGARGNPLLQTVLSLGFIGVVFALGARRCPDLASFLLLFFASAFCLNAFAVNPETQEVMQQRMEVLHSKPIGARAMSVARTAFLAMLTMVLSLPFALAPLAAASLWFGLGAGRALLALLVLLTGSFALLVLWLAAQALAMRWMPPERIRKVGQTLFMCVVLLLGGFSLGWLPLDRTVAWLAPVPSSWFASFALPLAEATGRAQRAGAVALVVLAGLLVWRGGLDPQRAEALLAGWRERTPHVPRSWAGALLEHAARVPLLGRLLLPPPVRAVCWAILTLSRREEVSRLKVLAPQVIALGGFVAALAGLGDTLVLNLLAYVGFSSVIDGVSVIGQTAAPAAGWIFRGAPLPTAALLRAMRLAVALRFLVVPAGLLTVLLLRAHPAPLALALALAYVLLARALFALGVIIAPALPLAREHRAMHPLWGIALGFAVTIAGGVGHALLHLLAQSSLAAALLLSAFGAAGLALVSWALGLAAQARLAGLEHS